MEDITFPIICKISFACFYYLQGFLLSSSFQQNWFHFIRTSFAKDIAFPVCKREALTFPIWFHPKLLDYEVSLHILVELVATIPTSPRSSKTESGSKSYACFGIGVPTNFQWAEVPPLLPLMVLATVFGRILAVVPVKSPVVPPGRVSGHNGWIFG